MKKSYWGDKGSPGPEQTRNTVHVEDLMVERVMTVTRHQTVGHARELMSRHSIHSLPVVDGKGEPVGIVTTTDMIEDVSDETLIGKVMIRDVQTVTRYAAPQLAARMMRKHHIHHLVVTHEGKIVGLVSSFDLLRLVEDRRFVSKNQASKPKKSNWEKRKGKQAD